MSDARNTSLYLMCYVYFKVNPKKHVPMDACLSDIESLLQGLLIICKFLMYSFCGGLMKYYPGAAPPKPYVQCK